jgi:hypothetical protein
MGEEEMIIESTSEELRQTAHRAHAVYKKAVVAWMRGVGKSGAGAIEYQPVRRAAIECKDACEALLTCLATETSSKRIRKEIEQIEDLKSMIDRELGS